MARIDLLVGRRRSPALNSSRTGCSHPRFPSRFVLAWLVLLSGILSSCGEPTPSESLAQARSDTPVAHALKHADPKYVCPMHPQIVRDEPGSCPICGMTLVKRELAPTTADASLVTIAPEVVNNMGVRTAQVERGPLWKRIDTVGYVVYDEDRVSHVHPRASGWVEKLLVRAEGEPVKRGEALLEIYAPEIVAALEEYVSALANSQALSRSGSHRVRESGEPLEHAARARLRLLEVPEQVIDEVARSGKVRRMLPVLAPRDGTITKLGIREGMYVKPELEMFAIADLAGVWVLVDVFEHQMSWVAKGQPAEVRVAALPGRVWKGEVDYVYPELDPITRTLKVRLRFANPEGWLKPNMFADAAILGGPLKDALTIPRQALIETGQRQSVVLDLGQGRFKPVEITTGIRAQDRVQVISGLTEGMRVVVSGQFLIDSESNLQASFTRFGAGGSDGQP